MPTAEPGPDNLNPMSHSFIVRIWREDTGQAESHWRGHVTHVPGNERHYFERLDALACFIEPYLRHLESPPRRWGRLRAIVWTMRCHLLGVHDRRAGQ